MEKPCKCQVTPMIMLVNDEDNPQNSYFSEEKGPAKKMYVCPKCKAKWPFSKNK